MAGRGKPPAPLKIFAGRESSRKGRGGKGGTAPNGYAPRGRPKCPAWLGKIARAKWRELVPLLDAAGILSTLDTDVLASYVTAWEEFRLATETLNREGRTVTCGTGGLKSHPAVSQQRNAMGAIRLLGSQLGLSPEGRLRIHLPVECDEDDELAAFNREFEQDHPRGPSPLIPPKGPAAKQERVEDWGEGDEDDDEDGETPC